MLKNILVVDDNKVNRKSLRKILESDYNVFEAVNGEDAIEFLENTDNVISLILLDLIMPIMNGYEFLDRINHDIKFSSIPIIVEHRVLIMMMKLSAYQAVHLILLLNHINQK